jgi:RNA polymerase sigma-70 factor (ECF subfamily)
MTDREEAFMELVGANQTRLQKICRVYAHDPDAREDLYQDILMQLWRSLPSFDGKSRPGTWLYRVALNTALSRKRERVARREDRKERLNDSHTAQQDPFPTPDEHFEARQQVERLYAAIDKLGDMDKALIMLFLDDTSYRDIAEIVGISESNVGVKLHRIKKTLAAQLTEEHA